MFISPKTQVANRPYSHIGSTSHALHIKDSKYENETEKRQKNEIEKRQQISTW
jgi:hypothetical protein